MYHRTNQKGQTNKGVELFGENLTTLLCESKFNNFSYEFQVLLVNADSEASFDLEFFVNAEESTKMIEALQVQVLAKVEASPEYLSIILGLVEEAANKKVI